YLGAAVLWNVDHTVEFDAADRLHSVVKLQACLRGQVQIAITMDLSGNRHDWAWIDFQVHRVKGLELENRNGSQLKVLLDRRSDVITARPEALCGRGDPARQADSVKPRELRVDVVRDVCARGGQVRLVDAAVIIAELIIIGPTIGDEIVG